MTNHIPFHGLGEQFNIEMTFHTTFFLFICLFIFWEGLQQLL